MVISGETGAVFPVGDAGSLADLLSEFAANKKQMGWMREQARKQAQKYTVSVAVDRIVQAVETVTG
jgi:glycosyltransferase involved in cell wall biosynthesis